MSFLENLSSGEKARVHISVTPGVGLEMIQLDLANGQITNYAVRQLGYNETSRDIADYEAFKNALAELYEELGINPKSAHVVVNMPLVSFGTIQLGLLLPNDAITGAIQSDLEQNSYTFRRMEPVVSWQDAPSATSNTALGKETRQILYTAIQQPVIENLRLAIEELGSVLVGIENSLSSTLRALDYMNVVETQMQPNITWNLMIVNSTGYSLVSMSGKNIIDYYEEPLAIKSFEGDEIYSAINQSVQIALMSYPANYLYIVSDTDKVSASLLAAQIQTTSTIDFLENNSFKKQESLIPVSLNVVQNYTRKISLQVIGCALSEVSTLPLKFDFLGNSAANAIDPSYTFLIGEQEITLTKSTAMKLAGIFAAVVIGTLGLLSYLVVPNMVSSTQQNVEELSGKLSAVETELKQYDSSYEATSFDPKTEVERVSKLNRTKLMGFVALGDSVPKNVWIRDFAVSGDGNFVINAASTNVEDVSVFFRNIKETMLGTKLKLVDLHTESPSIEDVIYNNSGNSNYYFTITTLTEGQYDDIMAKMNESLKTPEPTTNNDGANANNNADANSAPDNELLGNQPVAE